MVEESQAERPADIAKIEKFDGFGEITVGIGSNWYTIVAALCLLNHPQVNKYLLARRLKMSDRITKTRIFPREGMALPNGEVYHEPEKTEEEE